MISRCRTPGLSRHGQLNSVRHNGHQARPLRGRQHQRPAPAHAGVHSGRGAAQPRHQLSEQTSGGDICVRVLRIRNVTVNYFLVLAVI